MHYRSSFTDVCKRGEWWDTVGTGDRVGILEEIVLAISRVPGMADSRGLGGKPVRVVRIYMFTNS